MVLNTVHAFAYRIFGRHAERRVAANPRLQVALQRAHIPLRPEVYIAAGYLVLCATLVLGALPLVLLVALRLMGAVDVQLPVLLAMLLLPVALTLAFYATWMVVPAMRAGARARAIDARLPFALNYMATMAAAGATPQHIFCRLAANPLYGEVREEAAWIRRDMELLGLDVLTALNAASDRTPSMRFQDVLQGAVTALSGGGDLRTYFLSKSEQFISEARQQQGRFTDTLGVVAESYVTVVVAAPLFLIVMLSVLISFGSSMQSVLLIGYILVVVLVPLAQAGFALSIRTMSPEV